MKKRIVWIMVVCMLVTSMAVFGGEGNPLVIHSENQYYTLRELGSYSIVDGEVYAPVYAIEDALKMKRTEKNGITTLTIGTKELRLNYTDKPTLIKNSNGEELIPLFYTLKHFGIDYKFDKDKNVISLNGAKYHGTETTSPETSLNNQVETLESSPSLGGTGSIRVVLNTAEVYFLDGAPYVDGSGRIQIPVRFVSEQLGAVVDWDAKTQVVTVKDEEKVATLGIGQQEVSVNGTTKQLDTAAIIKGGRTYVPLRFVSEALGATVKWDAKGRTAYISNGKQPRPQEKVFTAGGEFVVPTNDKTTGGYRRENMWSISTDKGLPISGYDIPDPDRRVLLTFVPTYGVRFGSYQEQCQQIEAILSQKISQKTVDEIMNYLAKKTDSSISLPRIYLFDGKYEIWVSSIDGDSANVIVRWKK